MKITTWNVNGLRAALGKGFLDWVGDYQPDVLCVQEVRSKPEQIEPHYQIALAALYPHITWNPAARPGYSGVATFSRLTPAQVQAGMGIEEFDSEGRLIMTRHAGFLLLGMYFPHGGHDHSRVPFKLDFYARLLDWCDRLHAQGERLILCGDFNTCHQDIDLRNPKANADTSGFLPEERVWIDYYLEHGFVDIYRQLYPQRVQYTWWTYRMNARQRNVGWRLDYFLISQALVERVQDVVIHEDVAGSDHCPVTLLIDEP
jgi:exodeoxyribonuclease-3